MLRHFQHQGLALVFRGQRRQDGGQGLFEPHVHDRAQDLGDGADIVRRHFKQAPA
jgi:hypothetical protein